MKIKVENEGEVILPESSKVSDLIQELDYHQDSVIVIHDGKPMPEDEKLKDDMKLKIISVVSGG
jgi:sulfur carrier protein ThiS